ncbi:SusD/RagB family nutrient-binding outer membrane lipoprotein [Marivirga arenosa]|uniref:SusD/RagB family nutrient-binding outer membrane lipoprotein n=1 Tax=Marivirga arenosa TaxID=3059076 RepID=A0AA51X4X2_9BACT|nr:SusD/RagB family nutrient-binding outer membrane lipoprotein [Marivirga sp. BKB1-2]WNB17206.1 SusD/RagB family nutrient-binding outer membrane lipoprotein [Marivirga sp. BKB1-2]
MKNIFIKLSSLFLSLILLAGCSDFDDMNIDPKKPANVDPNYLFTYAEIELSDYINSPSNNTNVGRLLAQQLSQVTYVTESRYLLDDRQISDALWNNSYRDVLNNLMLAKEQIPNFDSNEDNIATKNAMITVLEVYTYQLMVDAFGDIPYGEALAGADVKSPAYDDAATIYADLVTKLDGAISDLNKGTGFGSADVIYGGSNAEWVKFANALKIRLGMRLADVNSSQAQSLVETAAANTFTSNADNATLEYAGGSYANPIYVNLVVSGRNDYVISETFVDIVNPLNDPRRAYFMEPASATGDYAGLRYGLETGVGLAAVPNYSTIGSNILGETFRGVLMDYSEVASYLAEAAQRGWNVGGSAQEWYEESVTASITDWASIAEDGNDGVADAAAYLAQPEVAFATAEDGNAMNAIAKQRYISLFNRGMTAWYEWRRMDYPSLVPPEGMSASDIPTRLQYPVDERSVNNANRQDAASAIGGDDLTTKVFWDVK